MKLGNLQLRSSVFLAPLSGVTDYAFRQLAKEMGCGLAFTEMVSAEGLLRKGDSFLRIGQDEHPVSVQLFGSDPEALAEAASRAEAMGADAVDLNMGCPAKQVVKRGAGVDLMRFPDKVKRILAEVRKKVKGPFTVKIRSGWDRENINAVQIAKIAEDSGVDAISLHPRTKAEGFRGQADWTLIGEVKTRVSIPVIGNGDVTSPSLAKKMFKETSCDAVMIGRGALGNPWIFLQEDSEGGLKALPSLEDRQRIILHHLSLLQGHYGEKAAVKEIRKHLYWYTKGLPHCASFHSRLSRLKEKEALLETLESYFDFIRRKDPCHSFEPGEKG
jgi:tRNA-dihydrouridine synthase B